MDVTFPYILTGVLCAGYLILIAIARQNRQRLAALLRPLSTSLLLMLIAQSAHLMPPDAHQSDLAPLFIGGLTAPALAIVLDCLALVAFASLSLIVLEQPGAGRIRLGGLAWWITIVLIILAASEVTLGQPGWIGRLLDPTLDVPSIVVLGGWLALGTLAAAVTLRRLYRAHLPEIANRAMLWLLVLPLILMGTLLGANGSTVLAEIGWTVRFAGMLGVVYGTLSHRVFDLRQVFRQSAITAVTALAGTLILLIAFVVVLALDPRMNGLWLALLGLALVVSLILAPLQTALRRAGERALGRSLDDMATIAREYSQQVTGVVELSELADVACDTLRRTLRVRGGGLLLATQAEGALVRIEPVASSRSGLPVMRGWLPLGSAIYRTLAEDRRPLLQYDLEYARAYDDTGPEIKAFFSALKLAAYAPIVAHGQVIGLLGAASRLNDEAFSAQDLELLATLAAQTGIALRNARLVSDLRRARDETEALNQDILKAQERLEQLDSVKTDFVTIASHELRTPLAQIRGYTDILEVYSEQELLDEEQVTTVVSNLRKATDRLERLIADMLDVSQLGLDAMDLHFTSATLESVLRQAIEPLSESINQRRLQLTARGLKALPPIEGDSRRLVQAFRNIIVNAVKYTPDGGRIEVLGYLQRNEQSGEDEILVTIQDTGIGIDATHHELIFEKFYRVGDPGLHSTGATKFMGAGPGLGLTIARGVIQGHGGRIWVESQGHDPEQCPGTTVFVTLPISPPASARRVLPFEETIIRRPPLSGSTSGNQDREASPGAPGSGKMLSRTP